MKYIFIKQLYSYQHKRSLLANIAGVCCVLLLAVSCESFLEIDPPQSKVIGGLVFEEKNLAESALAGAYLSVRDNFLDAGQFTSYMGVYADELNFVGSQAYYWEPFINNNVLPTTPDISFWQNGYTILYKINAIIEGMDNSVALSQETKDQLKGEALFLRACVHFYLVNLFGDIPYITTTDYIVNSEVSRISEEEVYTHLVDDLEEAKALLQENYLTGERVRANKWVATALLARVYLYSQKWEKAAIESTALIENTLYEREDDLSKLFFKESTSTIWSLKPYPTLNASEGSTFYVSSPLSLPYKSIFLSDYQTEAFEPGDLRWDLWVERGIMDNEDTVYYSAKYKETWTTEPSKEYSIVLRIEEQYLIRAEARAHLEDYIGAQEDINEIRNRANLGDTPETDLNGLLDAVLQERRVELFLELAHRWFDLKRMGRADAVLDPIKPGWDATDVLLPVPESEILVNPNLLPQNDGYN